MVIGTQIYQITQDLKEFRLNFEHFYNLSKVRYILALLYFFDLKIQGLSRRFKVIQGVRKIVFFSCYHEISSNNK